MNRPLPLRAPRMIRHIAACAGLHHRGLQVFVYLWVLVFEFDLAAAELDARKGTALTVLRAHEVVAPIVPPQRMITRRLGAGVEMLMKPLIERYHHAPWLPIDPLHGLALRP